MTSLTDIAVCGLQATPILFTPLFFSEMSLRSFRYPRAEWVVSKVLLSYFLVLTLGATKTS